MARTPKVVEDRREQIIDAAMRVFAQKGFLRATNKDIAHEAHITPGLIYHYFENKEAVFNAVIEGRSPIRLLSTLSTHELEQPAMVLLPFLIERVLAIVEDEPFVHLIRVFLPEAVHNPQLASLASQTLQRAVSFLCHYLQACMVRGELRQTDASLTAQVLLGSIIGFVLRRQILHDPLALSYTHKQIAQTICHTTLSGLLPR